MSIPTPRARTPWARATTTAARAALVLLAGLAAGCTTSPAEQARSLSWQDPKFQSPRCQEMRAAAASFEAGQKKPLSWAGGALLGPYGLAIAAAGKEHRERQRKLFARDIHLACSSAPLPAPLQRLDPDTATARQDQR